MASPGYTVRIRGASEGAREYQCETHGPFELVVDLATSSEPRPCPTCAAPSERTVTTNLATHVGVGMFRGKSDPPPNALAMDTRGLAEGKVTMKEFRAKRRAMHRDNRRAEHRKIGLLRR